MRLVEVVWTPDLAPPLTQMFEFRSHKIAGYAQALGIPIGLMLDNDTEGETGARQSLPVLAEHWSVRLIWSSTMYDDQFKGRQPESLKKEDWQVISEGVHNVIASV